jgi:AcrR family transcriptional regulator
MPKTENKKEAIVVAALKLFATHGYASTPVSLIAKTAGVSQGLMYNFFNSKEALLHE